MAKFLLKHRQTVPPLEYTNYNILMPSEEIAIYERLIKKNG